jgi:hypothetical protein
VGLLERLEQRPRGVRATLLGQRPGQRLDVVGADLAADGPAPVTQAPVDARGPAHEEVGHVAGIVEVLRVGALDVMAELLEGDRRVLGCHDALRMGLELTRRRIGHQPDLQPPGVGADLFAVEARRWRGEIGVARGRALDDVEDRGGIAHGAGDRELHHEAAEDLPEVRGLGGPGPGRLEPDEPTVAGRDPDRTAPVVGVGGGDDAGRHGGRRAAARAAGRAVEVPRVVGGTVGDRLGGGEDPQLGSVGPPDDHEPGLAQAAGEHHVVIGPVTGVAQHAHAFVDRGALHVAREVLDQQRDAAEGAVRQLAGRRLPGLLVERMDDRVQFRVQPLGAGDRLVDQLGRGGLAVADQAGLLGGVDSH